MLFIFHEHIVAVAYKMRIYTANNEVLNHQINLVG